MSCDEYLALLVRAMRGEDSTGLPQAAFQLHLSDCPRCQFLLQTTPIAEALARIAASEPPSEVDAEVVRQVERRIRRRRLEAWILGPAVAAVLLLGVALGSGWLGDRPDRSPTPAPDGGDAPPGEEPAMVSVPPPDPPPPPAPPATPEEAAKRMEEIAKRLATEEFEFWRVNAMPAAKTLMLDFVRRSPDADPYAFARSAALAGVPAVFPANEHFVISIVDEEESGKRTVHLRIYLKPPDGEPDRLERIARLGPVEFCRLFVLSDRGGETKDDPEGEK